MDSGFDGKSREKEADRFFNAMNKKRRHDELEHLRKENFKLMEMISMLQKDGYTYEQLNRKMIVCESCGKQTGENNAR